MLRFLSDPGISVDNFYGVLCCDCLCGYFYIPVMAPYLFDDDVTGEAQIVNTPSINRLYKPMRRVAHGCYDETTSSNSTALYAPLCESVTTADVSLKSPRDDIDEDLLSNPDDAYYRQFDTVGHLQTTSPRSTVSGEAKKIVSLDEERRILMSCEEKMVERSTIRRCLTTYKYTIPTVTDIEKKRQLVDEYSLFKSKYDNDDKDEADNAEMYLENARNQVENRKFSDAERIAYYQKAIAFTNDLEKKNALKQEYRRFCYSIKESRNVDTASAL